MPVPRGTGLQVREGTAGRIADDEGPAGRLSVVPSVIV